MSPSKDRTLAAHVSSVVRVAKDSLWCWKEHEEHIILDAIEGHHVGTETTPW